jgi:EmrB/QacA subfamily drug resistance transporter
MWTANIPANSSRDGLSQKSRERLSLNKGNSTYSGRPWLLIAVICLGQFIVMVDVSIVNVALPSIQRSLGFTTANLQWVVNAYLVALGGFLLLGGRLGDYFGRRRTYLFGLTVFSLASILGASAQNQGTLIGARALQGLGAAILSPASLTLLTTSFTNRRERSLAVGGWTAMSGVGGTSGVLMGGVLTGLLSWRWIFLINIPIGIVAILSARMVVPRAQAGEVFGNDREGGLDVLGAITLTGALIAIVYGIAGTSTRSWYSHTTILSLALAAVLLLAFGCIEMRTHREPIVPFHLLRNQSIWVANLTVFVTNSAQFSMWLFMTLYLQQVLRFDPVRAGEAFVPQTMAILLGAQISSRLVSRFGPRAPTATGALLAAVGFAWLTHLQPGGDYWSIALGGGAVAAFGMGLSLTGLTFAGTANVSPNEAGLASGLLNTSRQMGGSIGLAVFGAVAAARSREVAQFLPGTAEAGRVALTDGFVRAFAFGVATSLLGLLCALLIPRSRPSQKVIVSVGASTTDSVIEAP